MFLALLYSLIIHQTVTFANPFHKYPYVFLLDIGNEELQANSEQIRVSIPGGSLALRFPAIGEGDSITHVRVSGIDFGTDLKANIVDGGPGYKYMVIVFMGNPGQAYDAVVTVSTLNSDKNTGTGDKNPVQTKDVNRSYKVSEDGDEEDSNDSAENVEHKSDESNEQLTSASNFYDSAENVDVNGKEDASDEDLEVNRYDEGVKTEDSNSHNNDADVSDYAEFKDKDDNKDYDEINVPKAERYSVNEEHSNNENEQTVREVDGNLYDKYNALRPHLYNDNIYPQEANSEENEVDYNVEDNADSEIYSPEDPVELDQMFNDEEVHNDGEKLTDSNNNYANADQSSAVAY